MRITVKHTGYIITCLATGAAACFLSFIQTNQANISNGIISAQLYLPDDANGYYRGVRFDRSGIIASLDYNGHSYYGDWYIRKYSPTNDDSVMGPVEAFDPVGYDDAKAGGEFLKIGVGLLSKPNDSVYSFKKLYPLINPGKWNIKQKANEVVFTHILTDTAYAYKYQKTVQLIKGKAVLVLSHTLKNTGKRAIVTSVFDHNFLVMDKQVTGPGITVTTPIAITTIHNRRPDYVTLQGNQLIYMKQLDKGFVQFTDLTNGKGAADYTLKIENHNTGAAVKITCDRPITKLAYWSTPKTICPEPYINININPGQQFTWTITYEYYTCDIIKN